MRGDCQQRRARASQGQLFSHLICRVGGLPVRSLEGLRAERTAAVCDQLLALEGEMAAARQGLQDALYALIPAAHDRQKRATLLRLKRDVHNLRLLRPADLEASAPLVSPELGERLRRFHALGREARRLGEELRELYARETDRIRRRFQRQVTAADFRQGLLLSSRTLYAELRRYARAPVAGLGSKERQIERGLMRYFSRMVMKTTPFATFCAIVPGELRSAGGGKGPAALAFAGDPQRKKSLLRLNKSLYANFLAHLIERPEVRRHLDVELNPTLREDGGKWVFLSGANGREVFQRVARTPLVDLFRELFRHHPHLRLSALVERLATDPAVDATPEEATGFVDRLLEIGLLRFRIGIREQEVNWDGPLREILDPIDDDHATRVSQLVARLREAADGYLTAPVEEREQLLDTASSAVAAAAESLEVEVGKGARIPFFEDAAGQARLSLAQEEVGEVAHHLVEYVHLTSRLAWPRSEQAAMRHFFDDFYGPGRRSVPLLQFYEEYYREHFKAHLERQQQAPAKVEADEREEEEGTQEYNVANPFQLPLVDAIIAAGKHLHERIRTRWRQHPEAEEIRLDRDDLEAALADVPPAEDCRSVSVFLQFLPGRNGRPPAAVANAYLTGFGKYFSRFLYLVPDEVRRALVANHLALTDQRVAEICGDAAFNANLHPPLVGWELSYPTGESGPSEEQLASSDLSVERAPSDPHNLWLRHGPTGKRVIPADLGFLNPNRRPPLYQLLSRFTPPSTYTLHLPDSPSEPETAAGDPAVVYRPRITFRGHLVLARRRWRIPAASFPKRAGEETESDYFLRLHRWRRQHGIPSEVFQRVQLLPAAGQEPPAERPRREEKRAAEGAPAQGDQEPPQEDKAPPPGPARRRMRDHVHKPQYVDFRNPLLVELFTRAGENLDNFAVILEERLPAREHLARRGADRFVTEWVVQVDFPDPVGRGPGAEVEDAA